MQGLQLVRNHSTCRVLSQMDMWIKYNGSGSHFIWRIGVSESHTHKIFCAQAAIFTGSQQIDSKTRRSRLAHHYVFFVLWILIFSGTNFMIADISKSHFLLEWEHVCPAYVWMSEAVCGSLCACVSVMALPCAQSPCMGLNEVGYERNCQVCATVGKPPSITSSSFSSSSSCFYIWR